MRVHWTDIANGHLGNISNPIIQKDLIMVAISVVPDVPVIDLNL